MRTLFSSFIGELGWHLCWWAPIVRYIAQQGGYEKVVLAADSCREHLTDDFCDEFIPLATDGGLSFAEGNLLAGCILKIPTGPNVHLLDVSSRRGTNVEGARACRSWKYHPKTGEQHTDGPEDMARVW